MTRSGGSLILVSSRYIAWLRSPLPSKLQVLHVWQISSMKALLEEFLLLKKYDVYQLKEIWAIKRTNKPVSHYQDTWSHRRNPPRKNENLPKTPKFMFYPLQMIRTSWNQILPLASKKLRENHLNAMGNI